MPHAGVVSTLLDNARMPLARRAVWRHVVTTTERCARRNTAQCVAHKTCLSFVPTGFACFTPSSRRVSRGLPANNTFAAMTDDCAVVLLPQKAKKPLRTLDLTTQKCWTCHTTTRTHFKNEGLLVQQNCFSRHTQLHCLGITRLEIVHATMPHMPCGRRRIEEYYAASRVPSWQ